MGRKRKKKPGWAKAEREARWALERNKARIEAAAPSGTRSQKPSDYRVGGAPSRHRPKF